MTWLLFIIDALRLALRGLSDKKARTVLTVIGVAIGPMALVAVTSVVRGYSDYILGQLQSLGQNLIIVTPEQGARLTEADLERISSLPGVKMASPFYLINGFVRVGGEEKKVTIYATSIDLMFAAINGLSILEGRKPSPNELLGAVIGYNIAFTAEGVQVYHAGDPIMVRYYRVEGGRLREHRVTLIVEGVAERFGGALFLSPDDSILVWTPAGRRVFGVREWTGILVLAADSRYVPQLSRMIRDMYAGSVTVMSFQGIARAINSVTAAMEFIALATSMAAFAVAVAGIAATMITSVMERYREIGVMKAVGFTDAQVLLVVLTEAALISLLGGAIGVALGSLGAYLLSGQGFTFRGVLTSFTIKAEPEITVELVAGTMALALGVGLLGGLVPAWRAAKIPPAAALRYE